MPEKKKQHYLPKFYMKNFGNNENKLYIYNLLSQKSYGPVPYENQCYSDYLYGKQNEWEDRLSLKENQWSIAIKKAINSEPLSNEDIYLLKEFAIYQRQRTLAEINHSQDTYVNSLVEMVKIHFKNEGYIFDKKAEQQCVEMAKQEYELNLSLSFVDDCIKYIEDLELCIIKYETHNQLIASDAPVISLNKCSQHKFGFAIVGTSIFYPVDKSTLIVIYDAGVYNNNISNAYIKNYSEEEVIELNKLQYISGEKVLLSSTSFDNNNFDNQELNNFRKTYKGKSSVSAFGPNEKRMIHISTRSLQSEYDFSFLKLKRSIERIPKVCRDDPPPRKWEKEWDEKLKNKRKIIQTISSKASDFFNNIGIDKKKYYRGIDNFYIEMIKYWQKNKTYNKDSQ